VFDINIVHKTHENRQLFPPHRFSDTRLQKFRDLENRVRDPSRSLEMSPCDRAYMTSY